MKTTIELPNDLAQRVKIYAVERKLKLKDTIAQLLEAGLTRARSASVKKAAPSPIRLKRVGLLKIEDIETAIAAGQE